MASSINPFHCCPHLSFRLGPSSLCPFLSFTTRRSTPFLHRAALSFFILQDHLDSVDQLIPYSLWSDHLDQPTHSLTITQSLLDEPPNDVIIQPSFRPNRRIRFITQHWLDHNKPLCSLCSLSPRKPSSIFSPFLSPSPRSSLLLQLDPTEQLIEDEQPNSLKSGMPW